jgi:predicted esterase YcpF (UPF0227 family)
MTMEPPAGNPGPTLVYLHGLNSSSRSFKASYLRERLAPHRVIAPNYPAHRPDEAIASLSAVFQTLLAGDEPRPTALIGSSMGGFYGQYLARRFQVSHLFMINPALTPWDLFQEHLGTTMSTADGERYEITQALIESTRAYGIVEPCDGIATTVFLERGDAVIDAGIAERLYARCGRVLIWDGGDHAFQHLGVAVEILAGHLDALARGA